VTDPILKPLLDAADASARDRALEKILVEHVQPVIARVLSRYRAPAFSKEDAEDLAATINLQVVRRLQEITEDTAILRLDDYVAAVAYNVVYGFLRQRYPERTRLKNRLRYLLTRDDRFAVWESGGEIVCGLAQWRGQPPAPATTVLSTATDAMLDRNSPSDALLALFATENAPLRLDDVVRIAADLWNVAEVATSDNTVDPESASRGVEAEMETRETVQALWQEVRELRAPQRAALLMNLRDVKGANGVALLLMSGVATVDEIAAAMGMTAAKLSEIWNDLPFDDNKIADSLNITRQQVINLRKAARERLARKLMAFERRKP